MNKRDRLTNPTSSSASRHPSWAIALVRHAARRAPAELSARLEEEWLADLCGHSSALPRLRFALGCCWARRVICHDPLSHGASVRPAAALAAGPQVLAALPPPHAPLLSRRAGILLLIAALHVVAIYGFSQGLGNHVFERIGGGITGKWIDLTPPADVPPPVPPPPTAGQSRDPRIDDLPQTGPITITTEPVVSPIDTTSPERVTPTQRPDPIRAVKRVAGGPGAGFPGTEEFYPSMSRQLGETGAAAVQVCVDARGRLTGAPEIGESSGLARLDAAALALARAGSGHYRSTTEDGKPVPSCFGFRVRFELR